MVEWKLLMTIEGQSKPRQFDARNPQDVSEFIASHIIPIFLDETGCVDPRRPIKFISLSEGLQRPDHHAGAVRRAGASFGYVMIVMAVLPELGSRHAVDLVIEWEESRGRKFTIHEDDHAKLNKKLGCGHGDRAAEEENEHLYGLPSSAVREAIQYLSEIGHGQHPEKTATIHVSMVEGRHKENGVLVVLSEKETVDPTHPGIEFFRYDKHIDYQRLTDFTLFLKGKGFNVTEQSLQERSDQQLHATLNLLANGLPIYEADLRDGSIRVVKLGFS